MHDQLPVWWRRRSFRLAAAALALVLIAAVAWWTVPRLLCGGEADLVRTDGECVGVTAGSFLFPAEREGLSRAFPVGADRADEEYREFAEDFRDVQEKIRTQNEEVAQGGDYVKVAFLAPLTPRDDRSFNHTRLLSSLRGLLTAQQRANGTSDFYDSDFPPFQVLLANEGDRQAHWEAAVAPLISMSRAQENPLVSVVGMPISSQSTQEAVGRLSEAGVPVVGGAAATDSLTRDAYPGFVRATPGVGDFTAALAERLEGEEVGRTMTVFDVAGEEAGPDRFVETLKTSYDEQLSGYESLSPQTYRGDSLKETPNPGLFGGIARRICTAEPDLVLFAGRTNDLIGLIGAWEAHADYCDADFRLTVGFMVTGLSLALDEEVMAQLEQTDARLVLATTVDPSWIEDGGGEAPNAFEEFEAAFTEAVGAQARPTLLDGYAAMAHDALATAVMSVRMPAHEIDANGGDLADLELETIADNQLNLNTDPGDMVKGAGGLFSFSADGGGDPEGKPVPVVVLPAPDEPTADEPTAEMHVTEPDR